MADRPAPKPKSLPVGLALIGSEIAGFAVVGVLIDYATGMLDSIPWATLVLTPLGLVAAMIHLNRLVKPR